MIWSRWSGRGFSRTIEPFVDMPWRSPSERGLSLSVAFAAAFVQQVSVAQFYVAQVGAHP